jgi:hypothetical protein
MNKTISLFVATATLLTSCQMYRGQFDCPPGEGIPCTSVTDIESMVIEQKKGPDILAGRGPWKDLVPPLPSGQARKVWIADEDTGCGCYIDGHYIYILPKAEAN